MISVVIPIYNAEHYLHRCIESILNQSYNDQELILVNDGSTDNSLSICEKFATKYDKVLFINQKNSGAAAARNAGIKIARGEYITFVDADDYIDDGYFEQMAQIAIVHEPDVIISNIKTTGSIHPSNNELIPKDRLISKEEIKTKILQQYYGGDMTSIPSMWNKFYKTELLKANGLLIDETRVRAEDYWFNFNVFKAAQTCYAISEAYYHYNTSTDGSVMKTFRPDQFEGYLETRSSLLLHNKDLQLPIDYVRWNSEFINNTHEFILMAVKKKKWYLIRDILQNDEFNTAMKNYAPPSLHARFIKNAQLNQLYFFSKIIYQIWALRIRN